MIPINPKIMEVLRSSFFNAISNFCNNLIYLVLLHFMALGGVEAKRHQNGIIISMCIVEISFGPIIQAFSNGLKQLYSQFYASTNLVKASKNILLNQCIVLCNCIGLFLLLLILSTYESILSFMNYDEEVIEMTFTGIVYIFISRLLLVVYECTRAQRIGLKIFGPFAVIQSTVFALTSLLCLLYSWYNHIGIHEAGLFMILHEVLKIICLYIFDLEDSERSSDSPLCLRLQDNYNEEPISNNNYTFNIKLLFNERQKMIDLLLYIKPLLLTLYIEYTFFNTSVLLSGRYSKDYIVPAVCFSVTNNLILKGILGISESVFSFCGTSFAARQFENCKSYMSYAIIIMLSYEAIFIVGLIVFSNLWARCFSLEEDIIANIHFYKYLFLVTIPIDGSQILMAAYLQVIEMKQFVTKTALFSYICIGIPIMYILGDVMELKLGGIWLAIGTANLINLWNYVRKIQLIDYNLQFKIAEHNKELNYQSNQLTSESIELSQVNSK